MFTATDRERLEKIAKNLACYSTDLSKEDEFILNAGKLAERIREIESRQTYYVRDGAEHKALTADDILHRFNELYALLQVDRVQEPYGTLRKRT